MRHQGNQGFIIPTETPTLLQANQPEGDPTNDDQGLPEDQPDDEDECEPQDLMRMRVEFL